VILRWLPFSSRAHSGDSEGARYYKDIEMGLKPVSRELKNLNEYPPVRLVTQHRM